jgi:hypothetical protein
VSDKLSTKPASSPTATSSAEAPSLSFDRAAGARILARSFYRELRTSGYSPKQLLALSTELIELITEDLKGERAQEKGAA